MGIDVLALIFIPGGPLATPSYQVDIGILYRCYPLLVRGFGRQVVFPLLQLLQKCSLIPEYFLAGKGEKYPGIFSFYMESSWSYSKEPSTKSHKPQTKYSGPVVSPIYPMRWFASLCIIIQ